MLHRSTNTARPEHPATRSLLWAFTDHPIHPCLAPVYNRRHLSTPPTPSYRHLLPTEISRCLHRRRQDPVTLACPRRTSHPASRRQPTISQPNTILSNTIGSIERKKTLDKCGFHSHTRIPLIWSKLSLRVCVETFNFNIGVNIHQNFSYTTD